MAAKLVLALVVCTLALTLAHSATVSSATTAKAPPPPGAGDCSTVIFDMMDCLDYVSKNSSVGSPDESCCSGVKAVVGVSPACLCEALKEASGMNVDVNTTRAVGLPATCKISVPGLGNCGSAPPPGSPPPAPSPRGKTPSPSPFPAPVTLAPVPAPVTPAPVPAPVTPAPVPFTPLPPPVVPTSGDSGAPAQAPSHSGSLSSAAVSVYVLVLTVSLAVSTLFYL